MQTLPEHWRQKLFDCIFFLKKCNSTLKKKILNETKNNRQFVSAREQFTLIQKEKIFLDNPEYIQLLKNIYIII